MMFWTSVRIQVPKTSLPPFWKQDKHVYEAVYEELKPVPDRPTPEVEKPPLPAKNFPQQPPPSRQPLSEKSNNNWTLSTHCGDKFFQEDKKYSRWSKLRGSSSRGKYSVEPKDGENSKRFHFWKRQSNASLSSLLSFNSKSKNDSDCTLAAKCGAASKGKEH